jgi:FkbM family methyltransferase
MHMTITYIDLGANHGLTIAEFLCEHPDCRVFGFEPTPSLACELNEMFRGDSRVSILDYAAWIEDGLIELFPGAVSDQSSTLIRGKQHVPEWSVDYARGFPVKCLDFDRWLSEATSPHDHVVVKMDIEGAEYRVLEKLIASGSIGRVKEIRVEWHWKKFPDEVSHIQHVKIRNQVTSLTNLRDWH